MSKGIRHHFVPQWYLRRFCDKNGYMHVLDKRHKIISKKTPNEICFEWDRYKVDYPKDKDYVEKSIYDDIDNRISAGFKNLDEISNHSFEWTMELVGVLEEFVDTCFWRSNFSENLYTTMLEKGKLLAEMGLEAIDSSNNPVNEEQMLQFLKGFKESIKPLAFSSSIHQQTSTNRYSHLEWQGHWHYENQPYYNITSDRPIVFKEFPKSVLDVASMCFFSYSPRISFIRKSEYHDVQNFRFPILQNMIHIDQAKRFVISHSRELLENMLEQYKQLSYQTYSNLRNLVFLEVPKT